METDRDHSPETGVTYRMIPPCSPEQDRLLPLLGRCFPEAWGRRPVGTPFPYAGTSAVAECGGRFVGHAAIQQIKIESGDGDAADIGGLASVGVDPEFRRRGIAAHLCRMQFDCFRERGFAFLALYTAKAPVYASVGWFPYANPTAPWRLTAGRAEVPPAAAFTAPAAEFDAERQTEIRRLYGAGACFPGKCRRYEGEKVKHSWRAYFAHRDRRIVLAERGYAMVTANGILEEFYAPAELRPALLAAALATAGGSLSVAVPDCCLDPAEAAAVGFGVSSDGCLDPQEGEIIMLRTFDDGRAPMLARAIAEHRLHLPAADKF